MIEIRAPLPHEVSAYYQDRPLNYEALFVNGEPAAMVALVREPDDRLWAYLDVKDNGKAAVLVRAMLRGLTERNEDVYVVCAEHIHPGADRLLAWLGFRETDEARHNMRVWLWPKWP